MIRYYDLSYDKKVSLEKDKDFVDEFNINMRNLDSDILFDIAENGNLFDFRLLCNSFSCYNKLYPFKYKNPNIRETLLRIKYKCQERINGLFGDYILKLANEIYRTIYNSNDTFDATMLFRYRRPNRNYRGTMITLVHLIYEFPDLIEKELDLANIKTLIKNKSSILDAPHFEDVYYRRFIINEMDDSDRRLCTAGWLQFMDEIFYKSYDTAINVLEEFFKIRYCGLYATTYWAHPATHVRKRVSHNVSGS